MTTMNETETFDFVWGAVPAHRHQNPQGSLGGWVANTAHVDTTAQVFGSALVSDKAQVSGEARVVCVGPVGSRMAMLTVYATTDGARCTTGCFENHTLDELLAACVETHGEDSRHTRDYRLLATAAFATLDARLTGQTPGERE